jgi:DNA-binding SARP family transcriptional activator
MLEFHALGGLTVAVDGREAPLGGPRQRRLLAMFLIHRNTVVSLDRLADAVFVGAPTPGANTTLRSYVARIRRVVADGEHAPTVVTQAPGYLLAVADEAFDVARFERGVAEAEAQAAQGEHTAAASSLRAALDLWQGEAYAEFADEDWARPEAQRLGELRLVAFERLFEAELESGRAAALIPEIEGLVDAHPTREGLRAQLMIALYRAGRQADSLRAFQDLRRDLRDELGLDPTPALVDLERRLLAQDPTLLAVEPAGQRLRGYLLGERLGTGRDGTVFAARLPGIDRELAIRVVHEAVADRPEFVRTFESTARRVASLDHPAIVPIQDYWREPGAAYLVMRRLHGGSLTDRLARGPLSVEETARLVDRVGGALLAASEAGLAHGRVSADSVLIDDAGDPCIGDFALAATAGGVSDRDVHDLAVLVRTCLNGATEATGAALARALAPTDRPAMAEFVPLLSAALADGTRRTGLAPNPYKGLRAFDEADAADFFGRADVVREVVDRLGRPGRAGRLVLVVGGSGTGKSSVVRAGVLPAVRSGALPGSADWFVTTMLPGATPFAALAESLRQVAVVDSTGLAEELAADPVAIDQVIRRVVPDGGQMLLLVDQFEELFTSATDRDQKAFLAGVLHAISVDDSRLRVVATLRADFYDRPLGVSGFGGTVNEATVTLPALSAAELEAAVVGPAERVGRRVESALVAELVSAVADEPAALPALQFTLYELAQRGGDELTLAAYRELGELDGAIAARAEELYRSLDVDERADVRRLFEQLVVVAAGEEPTRRRAPRPELSIGLASDRLDATVDRWTEARLLSVDRHSQTRVPTVELAHEALLREWPRLHGWIEESREDLGVLTRLRDAAAGWHQVDRDPGAIYRGAPLAMVEEVVDRGGRELPPLDDEFLHASRHARDAEAHEAAERIARQARASRRLCDRPHRWPRRRRPARGRRRPARGGPTGAAGGDGARAGRGLHRQRRR